MSAPIRPFAPATLPERTQGPSDAARAAQRAFFGQALAQAQGQTQAAASPTIQPAALVQPQAMRATAVTEPTAPVERLLRPGTFVDIKV